MLLILRARASCISRQLINNVVMFMIMLILSTRNCPCWYGPLILTDVSLLWAMPCYLACEN